MHNDLVMTIFNNEHGDYIQLYDDSGDVVVIKQSEWPEFLKMVGQISAKLKEKL